MATRNLLLRILLIACISLFHIHCSMYTADVTCNPVTFVALLNEGGDYYMNPVGFTCQLLVTCLAIRFILGYKHWIAWAISFMLGLFLAFHYDYYDFPWYNYISGRYPNLENSYADFYGYSQAFFLGIYYVALQLLAVSCYIFLVLIQKVPVIAHTRNYLIRCIHKSAR